MSASAGSPTSPASLNPRAQLALNCARVGLMGMLVFLTAHSFMLSPPEVNPLVPLLIQLIPWLLVSPGVLRGHARSHIFACFLSLVWFPQAVLLTLHPQRMPWGFAELFLCLLLFWATIFYVRWRKPAREAPPQ